MTEAVCRLTTQFPRIDSVATRRQKDFIVLSDRRCYDNTWNYNVHVVRDESLNRRRRQSLGERDAVKQRIVIWS